MAYIVMAYIVMAYMLMAYILMAYITMTYIVMAYIVIAYRPSEAGGRKLHRRAGACRCVILGGKGGSEDGRYRYAPRTLAP